MIYDSPRPAAELALWHEGKILISKRGKEPNKGKFDLPGGFVDANETLEKAVLREAKEELGLSSRHIEQMAYMRSFCEVYPFGPETYNIITTTFVARLSSTSSPAAITANDDVASVQWVSESDLASIEWVNDDHRTNVFLALQYFKDKAAG